MWGSDVSADVRFPSGQEIGRRLTFNEILDDLDFAALLHFEGHRGEWGMLFDVTYLEMSDGATYGPISTDTETEFGLYELAGVYTPEAAGGFSVLGGARIVDLALDLRLTPPAPSVQYVARSSGVSRISCSALVTFSRSAIAGR